MRLFKYLTYNANTISLLLNDQLYLARPDQLNDPNDLQRKHITPLVGGGTYTKEHNLSGKICSLTKDYNNFLMWTHYANQHKGLCLGFNEQLLRCSISSYNKNNRDKYIYRNFCYEPMYLLKVHYEKSKILQQKFASTLQSHPDPITSNLNLAMEKSTTFIKEKEYRIVYVNISDQYLKTANESKYLSIKESLESVYFGLKSNKLEIENIKKIFQLKKMDVKFYKATTFKNNAPEKIKFLRI